MQVVLDPIPHKLIARVVVRRDVRKAMEVPMQVVLPHISGTKSNKD